DEEAEDVDVHLYLSMIGSLMYLTASRPDIMFVVCACARFQLTPKVSHLHAMKRIFRYLKGQPKFSLWYSRDSPFDLEAFSDGDYARASLDRKSTTGEYVAATNCYGQVLWIQNQMLDYGFNFMNTKTDDWYGLEMALVINLELKLVVTKVSTAKQIFSTAKLKLVLNGCLDWNKTAAYDEIQFWQSATTRTLDNGKIEITITIDGKVKVVTEASVRRHLKLEDYRWMKDQQFNEAASTSVDVRHGGAATTITSLDAGHVSVLCTTLSQKVESLEADLKQIKKVYGAAYTKLIMKVKKLEKAVKTSQARRKAKIVVSDEEVDSEDTSTQGKIMIEEIDQDAEVTLVTPTQTYTRRRAVSTGSGRISITSRMISTAKESVSIVGASMPVSTAGMVDKGKCIMEEPESYVIKTKRQQVQERLGLKTAEERENIRARVEADEELTQRLQAEERNKYSEVDQEKMLVDLINQRKIYFVEQKAKAKRKKPMTQAQERTYMSNYIIHMGSYTLKQLKKLSFDEIKELFEATMRSIKDFVPIESEDDKAVPKLAEARSLKRDAEEELDQKKSKKQKIGESSEPRNKDVDEQSQEELQRSIRRSSELEITLSSTEPTDDKERILWVKLKRLFEPDDNDELWESQKYIFDITWRLYDTCGVHHVSTKKGMDIYMLVEKEYLLSRGILTQMLCAKLLVEEDNRKKVVVNEASIRRDLRLNDAERTACLPNAAIFEELARMSAETTAWNEFSSTMASAIICLTNNQKFNFSKYILDNVVKNLEARVKFFMFLRFIQVFVNHQIGDMSYHKGIFVNPSLTKKVFTNIKRVRTGFSRVITPLFETMMVKAPKEVGEIPTDSQDIPILTQPSTSQPQKKHKPRRKQRKEIEVSCDEIPTEERVPTPSHDPLPSGKDRLPLNKLMEICTKMSNRVPSLEQTKTNQAAKLEKLKKRVKKLKGKKKNRTYGLKRLYKGRMNDQELFGVHDLDCDEVFMDVTTAENVEHDATVAKKEVTTIEDIEVAAATTPQISKDELTLDHTLMEIKAAKPKEKGPLKKKDQIALVKEVARKLEAEMKAEMDEEERIVREKNEANIALIEEWDDVQVTIDADRCLEIVSEDDDDVAIEATPLSSKSPTIVDYKIYREGKISYFKIIKTLVLRASDRQSKPHVRLNDYVLNSNMMYGIEKYVNYSKLNNVNICFATSLNTCIAPFCLSKAMSDPNWVEAINNEIKALNKNNTWTICDLHVDRKPIGSKWIWKIKYKGSSEIERYKARIVANGFNQREGLDYDETFNPVVKDDFLNTSESSNDDSNVVNAPQELIVLNQKPREDSSQSPPQIDHQCCYGCGDPLDGVFCRRCTCESCGNGSHIGYNCPPKVSVVSNLKPCHNQNDDELPQTLTNFHSTRYSRDKNSSAHDFTPNFVNDSPNVFYPPPQTLTNSYEFCRNDAHYSYDCPPQPPVIHQSPQETSVEILHDHENVINSVQTFLRKFDRFSFFKTPKVLLLAWDRVSEIKNAVGNKQYKPEDVQELFRKLLNDVQNIHEELAEYINIPSWNCPAFSNHDDDDDANYTIAIIPEEPDNSLRMRDEHLDTIPTTELDKVIKSSVEDLVPIPSESEGIPDNACDVPFRDNSSPLDVSEDQFEEFSDSNDDSTSIDDNYFSIDNIDYGEASPPDSELVSLEEVKDDNLREKLMNINLLIAKVKSLNANATPDHMLKSLSPSHIPVEDNDSFLEKSNTSLSYSNNSLPEFETFNNHSEETNSGKPRVHVPNVLTTHPTLMLDLDFIPYDNSLPESEIFYFDIEEKNSGSTTIHVDISLPDHECFNFKPDPGKLTSIVNFGIRENVLSTTNVNLPTEEDHSPLFDYVVWIFLSFLTYPMIPLNLLSSGMKTPFLTPALPVIISLLYCRMYLIGVELS
nr:putative reverse transcriptase, RNA-dependent DNA polymerase, Gag-polypeptide of LTR copia-type [Tanacetum cinerariifolium]